MSKPPVQKKFKLSLGVAIPVLGIALIIGVLALTQLTVNNNVTITQGTAIGVATFTAAPTACPSVGDPSYGKTSPFTNTVPWTITAGGSQTEYFCIENQGSGVDSAPSITLGTVPTTITCTTPPCLTLSTLPATIPSLAQQSVSAPIAVTLAATPSTTGSGTVPIDVS